MDSLGQRTQFSWEMCAIPNFDCGLYGGHFHWNSKEEAGTWGKVKRFKWNYCTEEASAYSWEYGCSCRRKRERRDYDDIGLHLTKGRRASRAADNFNLAGCGAEGPLLQLVADLEARMNLKGKKHDSRELDFGGRTARLMSYVASSYVSRTKMSCRTLHVQ